MTYSCSDFTDSILDALGISVPDEDRDDPEAQANLALAEIKRLQTVEHGVKGSLMQTALAAVQQELALGVQGTDHAGEICIGSRVAAPAGNGEVVAFYTFLEDGTHFHFAKVKMDHGGEQGVNVDDLSPEEDETEFRNYYRCDRCGHEWTDVWTATCDDDCPRCGHRHMTPYKSEDV